LEVGFESEVLSAEEPTMSEQRLMCSDGEADEVGGNEGKDHVRIREVYACYTSLSKEDRKMR